MIMGLITIKSSKLDHFPPFYLDFHVFGTHSNIKQLLLNNQLNEFTLILIFVENLIKIGLNRLQNQDMVSLIAA